MSLSVSDEVSGGTAFPCVHRELAAGGSALDCWSDNINHARVKTRANGAYCEKWNWGERGGIGTVVGSWVCVVVA